MTNDITQADVDAAVDWYAPRRGRRSLLAESFAAHRQAAERKQILMSEAYREGVRAERDRIVEFIRSRDNYDFDDLAHDIAAGEHMK